MDDTRFDFGLNWQRFVRDHFHEERVAIARECLLSRLALTDLKGKYFLDIGCGSGLSSLAANDAGASRIVSFDLDPVAVATTRALRDARGSPSNWEVRQGSILDATFLSSIDPADIVYSWGVLHHTGAMWKALENAAHLRKPEGVLFVALYTTSHRSPYWIEIKRRYNAAARWKRLLMEWSYVLREVVIPHLRARKNPLRFIREYKRSRGMEFMVDVRDWLGGYPYEDARIEEVLLFSRARLGLEVVNLKTGEACTEYILTCPHLNTQWRLPQTGVAGARADAQSS